MFLSLLLAAAVTAGSSLSSSLADPTVRPLAAAPVICVDPGHGTVANPEGAVGEASRALRLAEVLEPMLVEAGFRVVVTRRGSRDDLGAKNQVEDNRRRAEIANGVGAALFLRLQFDAPNGAAALYVPRRHPDRELAGRSEELARVIWQSIEPTLDSQIRRGGVRSDEQTAVGARQNGLLTGSRYATVPVVLLEVVPLNAAGVDWIDRAGNERAYASAVVRALKTTLLGQ